MPQLFVKQKWFSLSGRFSVTDAQQQPIYYVQASFLRIPKQFTIYDMRDQEVALIEHKVLTWLPAFYISLPDGQQVVIKKDFTLFKPHYSIEGLGISIHQGNLWDMDFEIQRNSQTIGSVHQAWLSWDHNYEIDFADESDGPLLVSIILAIDYVKQMANTGGQ